MTKKTNKQTKSKPFFNDEQVRKFLPTRLKKKMSKVVGST